MSEINPPTSENPQIPPSAVAAISDPLPASLAPEVTYESNTTPEVLFSDSFESSEESDTESLRSSSRYRDNTFYYDCKIFLVENCLFQIPLRFLATESEVFAGIAKDLVSSPGPEVLSDENPIHLEGVLAEDFRQLLRVLCPPKRFNQEPLEHLSLSQWTSVLKLADKWSMKAVRDHAITSMERLPDIDSVDKVVIARTYGIHFWLAPLFNEILQRPQSFTERDVQRLGLSTVLRLMSVRDRLKPHSNFGPGSWVLSNTREAILLDFTSAIRAELPDFEDDVLLVETPSDSGWKRGRKKHGSKWYQGLSGN
ncbi:hypothetical protein D9757_002445 [Collybiopsis confluens]|uniref:BTB domain-containing protein n=1 Tax=Collybiopsis confluens TaxID=2823264 RepID=A0A8H5HYS5_9AGAR|nr:hypothetical protein D9757_002445 [Collybiopsis confluens]